MPAALERKLKRAVSGKKMSKERKDAYVYGTLRKTGWKPSREKKMSIPNTRLIRLAAIDDRLNSIIQFDDDDDKNKRSLLGTTAQGAALVGAGVGGTLGHQWVKRQGGYGAVWNRLKTNPAQAAGDAASKITGQIGQGVSQAGQAVTGASKAAGSAVQSGVSKAGVGMASAKLGYGLERSGLGAAASKGSSLAYRAGSLAGKGANVAGSAWKNILAKLGRTAATALESKDGVIEFDASILGPWQGSKGHTSKIDQLEFPSGLSPAQLLKFPLPVLMRFMNQRNLQQQVFSRKHERLIEFNAKLDSMIEFDAGWAAAPSAANYTPGFGGTLRYVAAKKKGFREHDKRAIGRYIGTGTGLGLGIAEGIVSVKHGARLAETLPELAATTGVGFLGGAAVDQVRKHRAMRRLIAERAPGDIARIQAAGKSI